jgi:raffinose/stachyose/melibiose transport system permease protein
MAAVRRIPTPSSGPTFARRQLANLLVTLAVSVLLIGLVLVVAYPLLWMLLSGFKTGAELFGDAWGLPGALRFENYVKAWDQGVVRYLVNSVLVTGVSIVGVVLIGAWAAYGLTRLRLRYSTAALFFLLGGMMLAPSVALIPLFRLLRAIGIYDSYLALILPYVAFRLPITVFLVRAYLVTLPRELEDAAVVDGANRSQIFWKVIVPLSRPILVSAALLQALFAWNEFPFALVFINNRDLKTLPVGLLDMQGRLTTDWPVLLAALTIASLPMIALFLAGQRQFIRGLAEGYGK